MAATEELLSVAETAERLARSTEQVRRYLREGRLPGRRVGGQWFVAADALATFRSRRRTPSSFLDRIAAGEGVDPLGSTIGIGRGAASDVAAGKDAYRHGHRWSGR